MGPDSTESTTGYWTTDISDSTTSTEAPPNRCPVGAWGNIPHEYRCDSFYMCAAGNAIQLFCSDGFEFDPELAVSLIYLLTFFRRLTCIKWSWSLLPVNICNTRGLANALPSQRKTQTISFTIALLLLALVSKDQFFLKMK